MKTSLDFISLQVRDRSRSRTFYANVLGFQVAPNPNPAATVFQDAAGAIFALRDPFAPIADDAQVGTGVGLWFSVTGKIEDWQKKLEAAGTPIITPPYDTPFGRAINCTDPDGYAITLYESAEQ